MRPLRLLLLACLTLAAPLAAQEEADPLETRAAAELAKAEQLAAKGRYDKAVALYEKIAEDYGSTRAGRAAARRTSPNAIVGWADVLRNGPSENRVDIVLMGDGYLLKKQSTFDRVAKDVPRALDRDPVLEEYASYFNILRANIVSEEDGVDGYGREYSTALGARMLESSARSGQVAVDAGSVRNYLAELPAEDGFAIVFVPRGTSGVGGRGVACVAGQPDQQVLRALGQAFVGLYDEYDVDDGLSRGPIPNDRNIANTEDEASVPWAHFLQAKVSGVGVYRGGFGTINGAWRPTASGCLMGTGEFFCPVCRELLLLAVHEYVDPIEQHAPALEEPLSGAAPHEFEVRTLLPDKHLLEARWWVLPEATAPTPVRLDLPRRSDRGPLAPIEADPDAESKRNKKGIHTFTVDPTKLASGRYRVVCRVVDPAQPRGERWSWVLKDERELLRSERNWLVVVE